MYSSVCAVKCFILFPLQVQICKRSVEVMDAVRRGAQLAIDECQFQFRNRRWNCSTLETMPVFGKVVTQGKIIHLSDNFSLQISGHRRDAGMTDSATAGWCGLFRAIFKTF